jgi:hypothetical protein
MNRADPDDNGRHRVVAPHLKIYFPFFHLRLRRPFDGPIIITSLVSFWGGTGMVDGAWPLLYSYILPTLAAAASPHVRVRVQ